MTGTHAFRYDEMTDVLGAWFVAYDGLDVLLITYRVALQETWTVQYRVRLYDPEVEDPFSGRDRFAWAATEVPAPDLRERFGVPGRPEMLTMVREMMGQLTEGMAS